MFQPVPSEPKGVEDFIYLNLAAIVWTRMVDGHHELLDMGSGLLTVVDGVHCVATVGHNLKPRQIPNIAGPFPSAVSSEQVLYLDRDLTEMVDHVFISDDPDFGCIILKNHRAFEKRGKRFVDLSHWADVRPTLGQEAVVSGLPWSLGTDLDPKDHNGLATRSCNVLHYKTAVSGIEGTSFLIGRSEAQGWPQNVEPNGISGGPVYLKQSPHLTSYSLAGLEVSVTEGRDNLRVLPIADWISWVRARLAA